MQKLSAILVVTLIVLFGMSPHKAQARSWLGECTRQDGIWQIPIDGSGRRLKAIGDCVARHKYAQDHGLNYWEMEKARTATPVSGKPGARR